MGLRIGQWDLGGALGEFPDLVSVLVLHLGDGCLTECVGHDDLDWGLRPQRASISVLLMRQLH